MKKRNGEDADLHSTAFQNVESILQAKQHAEEELVQAKEALEARANELARSVSLLRATFESTADAMLVTGANGEPLDHNDKLRKLWRLSGEQLQTMGREELWAAIGRQVAGAGALGARVAEIEESSSETVDRLALVDGRVIECVSNVQAGEGSRLGRVWSFRDITEQERSESRRRESAQRLRLAIAAGDLGDWSWDLHSDKLTLGARTASIFDLPADAKPTWKELTALAHSDDAERVHRAMDEALRDRAACDIEFRLARPHGEDAWVAMRGQGVYSPDGTAVGMIGVAQDITEKKASEIVQRRLAAIIESSDDAIISKDLDGTLRTWNRGAERIFGYSAEEIIGQSIMKLIPSDLRDEEVQILRRLRSGERVDHYETVRLTKDGRRINVSITVSPIRDSAGRIVGASKVARDITVRKRADDRLRHSEEALRAAAEERQFLLEAERSARAEAERASFMKDEFLATLSHELRTPLNAIVGWSQVLRARGRLDPESLEGLSIIDRNAKLQAQLIEDLLDMSRINSGKLRLEIEPVDMLDIVKAAVASVRHAAEAKGLDLRGSYDSMVGSIRGDPRRLQQAVGNLLSNAIKFTPKEGRIDVAVARSGSNVAITVADDGPGIDPEFLPHVFERFRQADATTTRRHGGLGLGLAIVKSIVEMHGGRVAVSSEGLGKGSAFTIELPVMVFASPFRGERRDLDVSPAAAGPEHRSLAGITVLAVDDEPDARTLIKRILEDCGARVVLADSATHALEALKSERPDVLISDLSMPGEDGYALIRAVRNLEPDHGGRIPAAALSALARPEDRAHALEAGYQMHLAKPALPTELTALVASLAQHCI